MEETQEKARKTAQEQDLEVEKSVFDDASGKVIDIDSILEMVKAFEEATGKPVKHRIVERRPGDIATCYSNPEKAKKELGWKATKTLKDMCQDSWRYIENQQK